MSRTKAYLSMARVLCPLMQRPPNEEGIRLVEEKGLAQMRLSEQRTKARGRTTDDGNIFDFGRYHLAFLGIARIEPLTGSTWEGRAPLYYYRRAQNARLLDGDGGRLDCLNDGRSWTRTTVGLDPADLSIVGVFATTVGRRKLRRDWLHSWLAFGFFAAVTCI